MLRCVPIFIWLLGAWCCAHGQNVTISGKVDSSYLAEEKAICVYTFDDYISYTSKELACSPLDEKGNFSLQFQVQSATYLFLMAGSAKAEMVAEPGKKYEINFMARDSNAVTTLSGTIPVEIQFMNSSDSELNFLMADFTSRYEAFLEHYRPLLARKAASMIGKIDTLKTLAEKKYTVYHNPYLDNYIRYMLASLLESISLKNNSGIFRDYLEGRPVQPANYDYMEFFNRFYSATASRLLSDPQVLAGISKQDFSSVLSACSHGPFLANDTIREAVVLKALQETPGYVAIKRNSVLAVLEQAAVQCKAEINRTAAKNLKKKLSVMNIGKPVPALLFKDGKGNPVALSALKGKYLYVNFWASWCSSCTREMTLIPELKKMYGNKIAFISISVDKKPETMASFLKKNPKWDWTFLYCDDYPKAKEEFNVLTVPTYYLIDPRGNVYQSPAPQPQDVEPLFQKIRNKK